MDDDAILTLWAAYMAAESCRPRTIKDRLILVRALLNRTGKTLRTIDRNDLILDLGRRDARGRDLSPRTKQNYRALYHVLFAWMQDEGIRPDCPAVRLPRTRVARVEANPLTTAELQELLLSGIYARSRLYALLYAYQGFRCVEIAAVSGDSIDWTQQRIRTDEAKGGLVVWRPIHPLVWDELQRYPRKGWLFPSPTRPGEHVTANNVSTVLAAALRRAGIRHRPHHLRAWHATELLAAGVPLEVAQQSMRLANASTIKHYGRVPDRAVRDGMRRLPVVEVPQRSGRRRAA